MGVGLYDKNGNIKSLWRDNMSNTKIDQLSYTYANAEVSNKLLKVEDSSGSTEGFKNGDNLAIEYTYDGNGNMLRDYNKGITTNIIYNHLNLPSQITFASGKIEYFYDAVGTKQKKKVTNGAVITTTDYAGNYIYQNNALQMINQPEGYLEPNGQGGYDYGYRLKDHLGNIRLTFVDFDHNGSIALSEITEENNYYPFGLKHQGYNFVVNSNVNAVATKFKYNGKELNDELGLDLYDYGARFYDAALGRFHTADPGSELYYEWTPYNYVGNNPIRRTDPTGMVWADSTAANDLKDAAQQRKNQYEKANARLDKKMDRASEKGNENRVSRLHERKGRNNTSIGELNASIAQIDAMGKDQNYTFEFQQVSGDGAHYVTQAANGNIVIQYSSTEIQLHETRHAYQYMTDKGGNWRWDSQGRLAPSGSYNSMVNWGLSEQSGYQVQYAYRSSSLPNSSFGSPSTIYDVTYKWVGGINSNYEKFIPYMNQYEKIKIIRQRAFRKKFINSL